MGQLVALDQRDVHEVWRHLEENAVNVYSAGTFGGGRLYTSFDNGAVLALDPATPARAR